MFVTKVNYYTQRDELVVNLYGRGEDGERRHVRAMNAVPYFYVDVEPKMDEHMTWGGMTSCRTLDDRRLWKVETDFPFNVKSMRGKYKKTYEADIPFERRIRIDFGIKNVVDVTPYSTIDIRDIKPTDGDITPRIQFLDIETIDPKTGRLSLEGEVIIVGIYDTFSETYYVFTSKDVDVDKIDAHYPDHKIAVTKCKDATDLKWKLVNFWKSTRPDIISAWNIDFDQKHLEKLDLKFGQYVMFDLLKAYRNIHDGELESGKLDFVAQDELGEGKAKFDYTDYTEFCIYNIKDVELLKRLNEKRRIIDYFLNVSKLVGCDLNDTMLSTVVVETYIMRDLKGKIILPTRSYVEKRGYEGSYVHQPDPGIYKNVVVCDLAAEYPSIIRSLNISPETKVGPEYKGLCFVAPNGKRYRMDKKGLLPNVLEGAIKRKDELGAEVKKLRGKARQIKREEYQSYKSSVVNAAYGIVGSQHFRLVDEDLGDSITAVARAHVKWCMELLQKEGCTIVAGDTDSIFFLLPEFDIKVATKLNKMLNDSFDDFYSQFIPEGHDKTSHNFKIELEAVYETFMITKSATSKRGAKKRYGATYLYRDGKFVGDEPFEERMKIMGYQTRRSDSSPLTKRVQKRIIIMILSTLSKDDICEYVRAEVMNKRKGNGLIDMAIPKGISKKVYNKNLPMHVRAAQYSNKYLGKHFGYGDKPRYIFVKHVKDCPKTDVLAIDYDDDLTKLGIDVDIEKCIYKSLGEPLKPMYEIMEIDWLDITSDTVRTKLEDFF